MNEKKAVASVIAAAMLFGMTACGGAGSQPGYSSAASDSGAAAVSVSESGDSSSDTAGQEETANPIAEYDTLEEAESAIGFDAEFPTDVAGMTPQYATVGDDILEVIYESSDGEELVFRKGTGAEDISGDSTEWTNQREVQVGDVTATVSGNGDLENKAVWTSGEYSYSVTSKIGLLSDVMQDYISQMK